MVASMDARGAVMVNATQTRTIFDMAGFDGSGFSPNPGPGQLDSDDIRLGGVSNGDMQFGDTRTSGDFARGSSSGGVITGGFYDFSPAVGDPMIGIQPTSTDWNNSTSYIDVLFQNNSGQYANNIVVEGELWFLNNEDRSSHVRIQLTRNVTDPPQSIPSTDFLAIGGVTSPDTATGGGWNSTYFVRDHGFILSEDWLAPGEQFIVRISGFDVGGSGSRDEFGFSDLSVIIRNQSLPEPRTMGFLVLGVIGVRYARDRRRKYDYHEADELKRLNSIKAKVHRCSKSVSNNY